MEPAEKHQSKGAFLWLLGGMVVSYAVACFYTVFLNPEIAFWKEAYRQKVEWADKLSKRGNKVIIVGGSSSAFQFDAKTMSEEHGIPTVNMGVHAGTGAPGILAVGLSVAKPGDTLLLAIEPSILTEPPRHSPLGYQLMISTGLLFREGMHQLALSGGRPGEWLTAMRPGLYHTTTMLIKAVAGRPLYRYNVNDLKEGGTIETDIRAKITPVGYTRFEWDRQTHKWLGKIVANLKNDKNFLVKYSLPLSLVNYDSLKISRETGKRFLSESPAEIEIIEDEFLGAKENQELFSDTAQHTTRKGKEIMTHELSMSLTKGN